MTASHEPASSIVTEDLGGVEAERVDEERVELRGPSLLGERDRGVDAADSVRDLGELGHLHDPGRDGI